MPVYPFRPLDSRRQRGSNPVSDETKATEPYPVPVRIAIWTVATVVSWLVVAALAYAAYRIMMVPG